MARFVHKVLTPDVQCADVLKRFGELNDAEVETLRPVFEEALRSHKEIFDNARQLILLLLEGYPRLQSAEADARIPALRRDPRGIPTKRRTSFHGMVGASPSMRQLYARIEAAARSRSTFLVVGESGTGKELVARALHECAGSAGAPFVAVNVAALPRDLIESELFGHRRGAFSGALSDYPGLFRAADGGTLFLDEITEMAPDVQGKLLRVLEERAVKPIGCVHEIPVDIRIIASTNRLPEQAARAGQLRQDLLYRLQKIQFHLPPLRERPEDLPLLVDHFIALFSTKLGLAPPYAQVERQALRAMRRYHWPGNVRELANAIESALTFSPGALIRLEDLLAGIAGAGSDARSHTPESLNKAGVEEASPEAVQRALKSAGGNKAAAARLLKVSRKTLYARLSKYGLR